MLLRSDICVCQKKQRFTIMALYLIIVLLMQLWIFMNCSLLTSFNPPPHRNWLYLILSLKKWLIDKKKFQTLMQSVLFILSRLKPDQHQVEISTAWLFVQHKDFWHSSPIISKCAREKFVICSSVIQHWGHGSVASLRIYSQELRGVLVWSGGSTARRHWLERWPATQTDGFYN